MIDNSLVLISAVAAAAFWTIVGFPLARALSLRPALGMAPVLGWGVHSAISNLLFRAVGFSGVSIVLLAAAMLGAALMAIHRQRPLELGPALPLWTLVLAAVAAVAPALTLVPKSTLEGVILAGPIFDHAKIAIVDEIARGHLPPLNPFFYQAGLSEQLAYYWGWYASAAQISVLFGTTGWEADVALTWFTAAASLALMMSITVWLCGSRFAALFVLVLSFTSNLRPFLIFVLGAETMTRLLSPEVGFGTWILNMPWVPQHMAAAGCATLAILLIARLNGSAGVITLALVAAAGIGSSAYIGAFTFPLGAVLAAVLVLTTRTDRRSFLVRASAAAVLAVLCSAPAVMDQAQAMIQRTDPAIAVQIFQPLGPLVPEALRSPLSPLGYWILVFAIEWPALYLPGIAAVAYGLRRTELSAVRKLDATLLIGLAIAGLAVTFSLRTVIGNNDLGWRAVMPALLVMTVFAAAGLARWLHGRAAIFVVSALTIVALPGGLQYVRALYDGYNSPAAHAFAQAPRLWEAVRRHAGPDDRVINNPLFLHNVTPWPTNISWALLSQRRSCYAVWEMVVVFSPLSNQTSFDTAQIYNRAFAGVPAPDDLEKMAVVHDCRVVLVVPTDGAWPNDPFATSPFYRLVEATAEWRIYRATSAPAVAGGRTN